MEVSWPRKKMEEFYFLDQPITYVVDGNKIVAMKPPANIPLDLPLCHLPPSFTYKGLTREEVVKIWEKQTQKKRPSREHINTYI